MAFSDVASKLKGGKGRTAEEMNNPAFKAVSDSEAPKGKGKPSKKGGFKEAVKNAKKKKGCK